jgi:signal transduction histidine kinase
MAAPVNANRSAPLSGPPAVPDKVNILLVDDQAARLLTYQSILADLNQNLVSVSSGLEALDKLMRGEYAVVLLDVSMPGMDGFEAARLIHEHPRFERTPIIFVTGVHMSELDRLRGYKLGAVDYVSVPVVPEILRSKVAVLVELYCKRRELVELNRHLAVTNEQLAKANATLQAEKTQELQALNSSLQEANLELERTNMALQGEVVERSRAEQALKQADRQKDEFLATLAHELRNPLAPIRNAVHLMKMKAVEDPQLLLSRDIIERQLIQLSRLVDDLLDVSRITRGKINLARERVELSDLIERAVETVTPVIEARGHTLTIELPKRPLGIYGDPLRLTQALGNVLGNAAKYTDAGGHITLRARRRRRDVEISVLDTGIGISPEVLPCIFDLFTQVDQGSGRPQGGLGIGLALVRRLVEMHDGSVTATSAGAGKGSEFVILLPVSVERAPSGDGADEEGDAGGSGPASEPPKAARAPVQRRILVADDNPDARESLAALLALSGHEVFRAQDGSDALQSAERHRPHVALLDIGMPLANGYEVARQIRGQPWGRNMVLIALTGWGQESDRRRSHEAGFNNHLTKPVDPDVLDELLARV